MPSPTSITVRIRDFPIKSAVSCKMLCRSISGRLETAYPCTTIEVVHVPTLPTDFDAVVAGTTGIRSGRTTCLKIHRMVKESLEHAGSSVERQKTNLKQWTKAELGDKAVRLLSERQSMELALRKVVAATSLLIFVSEPKIEDKVKVAQALKEAEDLLAQVGRTIE